MKCLSEFLTGGLRNTNQLSTEVDVIDWQTSPKIAGLALIVETIIVVVAVESSGLVELRH